MAFLILADGSIFHGQSVGIQEGYAVGELVFNTAQTGYQEILTDPSYLGQIINFTAPHIGNVGVNKTDNESEMMHACGAVFRDFSMVFSNWRAEESLYHFLLKNKRVALSGIDTRALTLHLREKGNQNACLVSADSITLEKALALAQSHHNASSLAALASTKVPYVYQDVAQEQAHIIVVDCGIKKGILQCLSSFPIKITVVPLSLTIQELSDMAPDGVLLSNGPGDPEHCEPVIALTRHLLKKRIPTLGICLGHQILALAAGARTKKMKFGHHGANHPVICHKRGSVFISSQNHGFVVDESTLPSDLTITHSSLFDGSIAGLAHRQSPAFSFQGHPEAHPGPNELGVLFQQFLHEVYDAKKYAN